MLTVVSQFEQISFHYSLKCCDILSSSYIVWKRVPCCRVGDEKSPSSKLVQTQFTSKPPDPCERSHSWWGRNGCLDVCINDVCRVPVVYHRVHYETVCNWCGKRLVASEALSLLASRDRDNQDSLPVVGPYIQQNAELYDGASIYCIFFVFYLFIFSKTFIKSCLQKKQ